LTFFCSFFVLFSKIGYVFLALFIRFLFEFGFVLFGFLGRLASAKSGQNQLPPFCSLRVRARSSLSLSALTHAVGYNKALSLRPLNGLDLLLVTKHGAISQDNFQIENLK
jgi:hypothetical protein